MGSWNAEVGNRKAEGQWLRAKRTESRGQRTEEKPALLFIRYWLTFDIAAKRHKKHKNKIIVFLSMKQIDRICMYNGLQREKADHPIL